MSLFRLLEQTQNQEQVNTGLYLQIQECANVRWSRTWGGDSGGAEAGEQRVTVVELLTQK